MLYKPFFGLFDIYYVYILHILIGKPSAGHPGKDFGHYKMYSCAVNIIARDSEDRIASCITSIINAGCFNQIVIVIDSRSNDLTDIIAKSYSEMIPMTIIEYDWNSSEDYEAGARNEALKYTDADFVLWLDTDEIILDGDCIRLLLSNPKKLSYFMKCESILSDGSVSSISQLRLFPLLDGVKWELPNHPQVAWSLESLGIKHAYTDCRILHTGYDTFEKVKSKHQRNLKIMKVYIGKYRGERRRYMMDRMKESESFVKHFSLAPALVTIIVTLITTGLSIGLSLYDAAKQAKEQANLQRELEEAELNQIVTALSAEPILKTIPQWQLYQVIKEVMQYPTIPVEPIIQPITPPTTPPEVITQNTMIYVILGIVAATFILGDRHDSNSRTGVL